MSDKKVDKGNILLEIAQEAIKIDGIEAMLARDRLNIDVQDLRPDGPSKWGVTIATLLWDNQDKIHLWDIFGGSRHYNIRDDDIVTIIGDLSDIIGRYVRPSREGGEIRKIRRKKP
jgi:hypothetical protein